MSKQLYEISFGKPKDKGNNLYYGIDIPVSEFIEFVGGQSNFKKGIKSLKNILMKEVEKNKKAGSEIGSKIEEINYPVHAKVSWALRKYQCYLSYSIYGMDQDHAIEIRWSIYMKKDKVSLEAASGWDG